MDVLRIVVTPGEPAGIGPELAAQLIGAAFNAELVLVADPALLPAMPVVDRHAEPVVGKVCVDPVKLDAPARPGQLDARNAAYVLRTLDRAIQWCQSGDAAALVTGPLHKGIINDAGLPFTGHTEYLQAACNAPDVVMMLACPDLRVALVTTHLPLSRVPEHITTSSVLATLRIVNHDLRRRFGIVQPRLAVCGLNPHAGEGGHLGLEDDEQIRPAIEQASAEGMSVSGPLPADTAFTPRYVKAHDAVIAMYHDQGLPVLKAIGFGRSVNITLGLPLIRTSVDHGTALDIAGQGKADVSSLKVAVSSALELAQNAKVEPLQ